MAIGDAAEVGGALWAVAAVLMYPTGLVYETTIGPQSTLPTVVAGAALIVVGGGWIALSVMRRPFGRAAEAATQPGLH